MALPEPECWVAIRPGTFSARTRAASEGYGREGGKPDRLADTQVRISYAGTGWVRDDAADRATASDTGPVAGDRAPDATGLRRHGVGFPLRLHEILRGTDHVLLVNLPEGGASDLSDFARQFSPGLRVPLRIVGITAEATQPDLPAIALYRDAEKSFAEKYGSPGMSFLVRPDGHIGWIDPSFDPKP